MRIRVTSSVRINLPLQIFILKIILGRGGYLTPGLVRLDQRVRTANQLVRTLRELMPDLRAEQAEQVRAAFADALGPNRPEAAIGLVPNLGAAYRLMGQPDRADQSLQQAAAAWDDLLKDHPTDLHARNEWCRTTFNLVFVYLTNLAAPRRFDGLTLR